jgi:hypothetical protein
MDDAVFTFPKKKRAPAEPTLFEANAGTLRC